MVSEKTTQRRWRRPRPWRRSSSSSPVTASTSQISRAKCLAHVVSSPRLLEARARTIEQMRLINALCRFVELADEAAR